MYEQFAPAKINLHLHATGKRDDGYHLLDSLVAFADCGDHLEISTASDFNLTVFGEFLKCVPLNKNTLTETIHHISQQFGRSPEIAVNLIKNLPAGAGIGGGSSDAAATIRCLNDIWNLNISDMAMKEIALAIGADVPVCVSPTATIMRGIGEVLLTAPKFPDLYAVLIWPNQHTSTVEIFKNFKIDNFSNPYSFRHEYKDTTSFIEDLRNTRNDLEETACRLYPVIPKAKNILTEIPSCLLARMTGSGSTIFGLFPNKAEADSIAQNIKAANPDWWVCSSIISGHKT